MRHYTTLGRSEGSTTLPYRLLSLKHRHEVTFVR
jgi:hypothetical protein